VRALAMYWFFSAGWMLYAWIQNRSDLVKTGPADSRRKKWPFVSVLVPARNEEKRIVPLLEGLARQDYPTFEVRVLDDQSTDGTLNLLKRHAQSNKRLKILRGKPLPSGWRGKPWACHQLAKGAKGEWLLFLDADTWHTPDMLKRSIQAAEERQVDFLSLLTRQVTGTWLESLVIPVMIFNFLVAFPMKWATKPGSPLARWMGFSGQFILGKRKSYLAVGGHEVVKNEIVEDLKLGSLAAQAGYRTVMVDGSDIAMARMYTRAGEVWEGFTKNFFPAAGFSVWKWAVIEMVFLVNGVLPFAFLKTAAIGWMSWSLIASAALALSLVLWLIRADQAVRYGFSKWSVLFHPWGVFFFVLIGVNSMGAYVFGKGGKWKGRDLIHN